MPWVFVIYHGMYEMSVSQEEIPASRGIRRVCILLVYGDPMHVTYFPVSSRGNETTCFESIAIASLMIQSL